MDDTQTIHVHLHSKFTSYFHVHGVVESFAFLTLVCPRSMMFYAGLAYNNFIYTLEGFVV